MAGDGTIRGFEADLERASEALSIAVGDIVDKLGFDLMDNIVQRTPIDRGTAAGNWQASEGEQPLKRVVEFEGSRDDALASSVGSFAEVAGGQPFRQVWLGNFLPYIERLEFGHSKQAPAGMVRVALAEAEIELEDASAQALGEAGL